jgi:hypothetical protein
MNCFLFDINRQSGNAKQLSDFRNGEGHDKGSLSGHFSVIVHLAVNFN